MNRPEFDLWLDDYCSRSFSVRDRFEKMGSRELVAQHDAWFAVLQYSDLADCRRATEIIFASVERKPFFDDIPAAVVAKARAIRDAREEREAREFSARTGESAYKCGHCRDTGLVSILVSSVPSQYQRFVETYGEERAARETVSAGCCCEYGGRTGIKVRYRPGVHKLPAPAEPDPNDAFAMHCWEKLERAIIGGEYCGGR